MTDTTAPISRDTTPVSQHLLTHLNGRVFIRAAIAAMIIGGVLTLTNQSGAIFGTDDLERLPLSLVFLSPFVVVAVSQLLGARQAALETGLQQVPERDTESFTATAATHGIPKRAVLVATLTVGTNATIVATATYLEQGSVRELPLPLLGQAFVLPVLFGILSQALSYRRAIAAFRRAEASLNG